MSDGTDVFGQLASQLVPVGASLERGQLDGVLVEGVEPNRVLADGVLVESVDPDGVLTENVEPNRVLPDSVEPNGELVESVGPNGVLADSVEPGCVLTESVEPNRVLADSVDNSQPPCGVAAEEARVSLSGASMVAPSPSWERSELPGAMEPLPDRARRLSIITAILFASAESLSLDNLQVSCGWSVALLEDDLCALADRLQGSGLLLQQVAGGWRLVTAPEVGAWVERHLQRQNRKPLSKAQLETLAIIAYRQPVTRAEIESYRGVKCERALHQLEEHGLIREVGHSPMPGRPTLFGTTREFLEHLSLNSLADLPPIERDKVSLRKAGVVPDSRADEGAESEDMPGDEDATNSNMRLGPSSGLRSLFEKIRRRGNMN